MVQGKRKRSVGSQEEAASAELGRSGRTSKKTPAAASASAQHRTRVPTQKKKHPQKQQAQQQPHQEQEQQKKKKKKTKKQKTNSTLAIESGTFNERVQKYQRASSQVLRANVRKTTDKKLRGEMSQANKVAQLAARQAARAELLLHDEAGILETENELERTYKVKQSDIREAVDVQSANKAIELHLTELGPYCTDYSRNGSHMLLGGRKGHVAMIEWKKSRKVTELYLGETVRDCTFLQDHTMFAVAQKKYVYVYDSQGTELHCMRKHIRPSSIRYLPYHWLLASVGHGGFLKYQDISTGQLVVEHRTRLGSCDVTALNPWNAIMNLGHVNGTVTLWSPNNTVPLVKMLCHKGPVRALAVDTMGQHMVSTGDDGQMKIWDLRTYKCLHQYYTTTPATSLDVSHRGIMAVAYGPHVQLWQDPFRQKQVSPYMKHLIAGEQVRNVRFCPFEDVLGVGHSGGFTSLLVPGCGEPNYDYFENNPYASVKQRREATVHSLLDKLQPDMIVLDPTELGTVDKRPAKEKEENARKAHKIIEQKKLANKARGKSSVLRRLRRKQRNIVDQKRVKIQERNLAMKERENKRVAAEKAREAGEEVAPTHALDRFKKRSNFT